MCIYIWGHRLLVISLTFPPQPHKVLYLSPFSWAFKKKVKKYFGISISFCTDKPHSIVLILFFQSFGKDVDLGCACKCPPVCISALLGYFIPWPMRMGWSTWLPWEKKKLFLLTSSDTAIPDCLVIGTGWRECGARPSNLTEIRNWSIWLSFIQSQPCK